MKGSLWLSHPIRVAEVPAGQIPYSVWLKPDPAATGRNKGEHYGLRCVYVQICTCLISSPQ